ncbi:FAD-binding protein [Streptomyces lichenis]|uniref:FAD-binding protein n=1 Tax=Streptomyces lichenis TaxID=2306967 RepID=A0ABT0I8A4_9ACTN|nr:FAD-binding protein [Streptomyces lichenis]MCK8677556.1 FAD-binding protein [Streptomyces lichenis]
MIGRRAFLTGAGAGAAAVVVGFDPLGGGWVTRAEAAARPERSSFARVPELDGELALDAASRDAVTTDLGNIVHQRPRAVLRPGSVRDVSRMVRFCREHRVPVAPRGQAHTTYGQGLADGLVIEMRSLRRIHALTADRAEVDAGIHWMELAKAAFARTPRRTPPVLTGYTQLTVGGTLSVGGIGGIVGGLDSGLQVDHVRELEVVTGTGEVVRCSRRRRSDLFDAVLGGLGQCGIITKAVLDLVPAKERARTYLLGYDDNARFFRDLRILIERPGIDHVYAEFTSAGTSPTYTIHATVFHEPAAPPKDGPLLAGVSATPEIQDTGYLEYVFSIDTLIDEVRATQGWDRLVKPWFDVWLPGETVERYLGDVLKTLTPKDIGPLGAGLLYPQRRSEKGRPLPRVPEAGASPWMFVIDINTVAEGPDVEPGYVAEMLARNERLYARTRDEYGGTLYPIGSVPMTARDWRAHFGDVWPKLRAAKRRYDPDGVLTPGQGVFGHRD